MKIHEMVYERVGFVRDGDGATPVGVRSALTARS